jgi:hypothetical protein
MQIRIARDGEALVPSLPEEVVPSLLESKAVLPSDHFWHEGMTEWMPLETWNSRPPNGSASGLPTGSSSGLPTLKNASAAI